MVLGYWATAKYNDGLSNVASVSELSNLDGAFGSLHSCTTRIGLELCIIVRVRVMVLNATFNNISVASH